VLTQSHGNIGNVRACADCKVDQASNETLKIDLDIVVQNVRKGVQRGVR